MFSISWIYLYLVGGAIYAIGAIFCLKTKVLDLSVKNDRYIFIGTTACLVVFAAVHAVFQFVLPFMD